MTDELPIACSLDGDGLRARLAAAGAAGRAGLISHERAGARHLLRFADDPATRARVEAIVRAERECCPFLDLDLEERDGQLVLSIEAPAEAEEVAAGLATAFTRATA